MKKRWLLLPLAACTSLSPLVGCSQQEAKDKFDKLIDAYKKMLNESIDVSAYKDKTASQIINSELQTWKNPGQIIPPCDTYYFRNINYDDPNRSLWPAHQHIVRALQIAILADQKNDHDLMNIAINLTRYWLAHNYVNPNWWFNEIGVPRDFSNLAIFLFKQLSKQEQQKMLEWIRHGSLKYVPHIRKNTGTNMFWAGDITLKGGLLAKDEDEINEMFKYVTPEIFVDKDEGFQSDGSYFQHGHQLYTGGYGRQGALLLARIASAFVGSPYKLDEDKLKIVVDFAVDGIRYFTHKKNFTWQCMGRTFTRKQASQFDGGTTDLGVIDELRYFAQLPNCPRKDELIDVLNRWKNNAPSFEGIRFFPKSCVLAYQNDGVYVGFKGTNKNLINCEKVNGENELSYNLTFGVNTSVMQTGDEYADISPLWKYDRIPGTTSIDESDTELKQYGSFGAVKSGSFYAGTSQDKKIGYVSQQTTHNVHGGNISYIITSIACDDGVVVLGSNIKFNHEAGSPDKVLTTTVEQCILSSQGANISSDRKVVTHNNAVYTNIDPSQDAKLEFVSEKRTTPWKRNNDSYTNTDMITNKILTITVDNSKLADKSKYAYSIQPKTRVNQKFKVAVNTDKAQGIVLPDGRIAALFLQDGSFEYDGNTYSGQKGEFKVF